MTNKSRFSVGLRHFGPMLLLLTFVVTADAYTIIMKSGRRIEIPAQFNVTLTTVTYDAGSQIQVTLETAAINIPATERANNEAPGSLLARIDKALVSPAETSTETISIIPKARRSVTNRDLEPYAQARRASEVAYERRRKELGLPSVAESRARAAADAQVIWQELDEKRLAERDEESYWRSRASELRAQISGVDAEINYVRSRLDEVSSNASYSAVSSVSPYGAIGPFGRFGRSNINPLFGNPLGASVGAPFGVPFGATNRFRRPAVFVAPGSRSVSHRGFGIRNRGRNPIYFGRGVFGRPFSVASPILPWTDVTSFNSPFGFYGSDYDSSALVARLDELVGSKAALNAKWRELENEARRAGVPPGWMRP